VKKGKLGKKINDKGVTKTIVGTKNVGDVCQLNVKKGATGWRGKGGEMAERAGRGENRNVSIRQRGREGGKRVSGGM